MLGLHLFTLLFIASMIVLYKYKTSTKLDKINEAKDKINALVKTHIIMTQQYGNTDESYHNREEVIDQAIYLTFEEFRLIPMNYEPDMVIELDYQYFEILWEIEEKDTNNLQQLLPFLYN